MHLRNGQKKTLKRSGNIWSGAKKYIRNPWLKSKKLKKLEAQQTPAIPTANYPNMPVLALMKDRKKLAKNFAKLKIL